MATTPPAAADFDSWMNSNPAMTQWFASMSLTNPDTTVTAFIAGWTQTDGTQVFMHITDPTTDVESAITCRGALAAYGAVTVRVYQLTWTPPTAADLVAPDATQAAANNQASWAS